METMKIIDEWSVSRGIRKFWFDNDQEHEFGVIGLSMGKKYTSTHSNKVTRDEIAVLILCAGNKCLMLHLNLFGTIPDCLASFLDRPDITFVGVGIENNLVKLKRDCGLECCNAIELSKLVAAVKQTPYLIGCGLPILARACEVELGDSPFTDDCSDSATFAAYSSFLIGKDLLTLF
ncbi:hypothetical protein ACFE04_017747 [Oxalis oulophora]